MARNVSLDALRALRANARKGLSANDNAEDEKRRRGEVRNQNAQRFDEMERRNIDDADDPMSNARRRR